MTDVPRGKDPMQVDWNDAVVRMRAERAVTTAWKFVDRDESCLSNRRFGAIFRKTMSGLQNKTRSGYGAVRDAHPYHIGD